MRPRRCRLRYSYLSCISLAFLSASCADEQREATAQASRQAAPAPAFVDSGRRPNADVATGGTGSLPQAPAPSGARMLSAPRLAVNEHPRPELIVREVAPSGSIQLGTLGAQSVPDAIAKARKVATIGSGGAGDTFGSIARVAVDDGGYIYVLDSEFNDVRVLDPSGRTVNRFGYQHDPATPFRTPTAIAVSANARGALLFIADRRRQVHVYSRRGDSIAFKVSITLSQTAFDLCALKDRLIVQAGGYNEPEIIRAYLLDGKAVGAFAPLYNTNDKILRYTFARARIACIRDTTIIVAPESSIPDVRAYSISGSPLWVTLLAKFVPVTAFVSAGGGVEVRLPPGGYHRLHSLSALPGGDVLMQVAYVRPPAVQVGQELAVSTFLLAGRSGRGVSLGDSLPTIAAVGSQSYVVLRYKPSPTIEIWSSRR